MDIENELKHWGILGMKWGVRRYQNEDGSLTPEGRERYLKSNDGRNNYLKDHSRKDRQLVEKEYDNMHKAYVKEEKSKVTYKNLKNDLENDLMKDYGLGYHDEEGHLSGLKLDKNGEVIREDGKSFEYYVDGKKHEVKTLTELATEFEKAADSNKDFFTSEKEMYSDNFRKNLKGSSEYNWWGDGEELLNLQRSFNKAEPAEDKDLDENVKSVMKKFNLNKDDLVIDKTENYWHNIFRKDGSAFEYSIGDDNYKDMELQYFADEGDWVFQDFKPLNPKGELKHWGIFGMKWGIRRYQNEDGSLTPAGRERYGVGPAKGGSNIGSDMSNDELYKMTKRYRQQADFYKARNDYLYEQKRYSDYSKKPPSFISKVVNKMLLEPVTAVIEDSAEFSVRAAAASMVDSTGGKYADNYVKFMLNRAYGGKNKNKNNNNNNNNP